MSIKPTLALSAIAMLLASAVQAADPVGTRIALASTPIAGLPDCDDGGVLASIRDRFAYGTARVEHRDLAIATIEAPRQTAVTTAPSPIARRWCTAGVVLTDGSRSTLWWHVDRGTGFAAPGLAYVPDGLEFCVAGHDPWRVHDGECRTTRRWW